MGTKLNPGKFDCYASAGDDEPIFILRANDPIAMLLVRLWSLLRQAEKQNESDPKALEALKCSFDMQAWLIAHKIEVTPSLEAAVQRLTNLIQGNLAVETAEAAKEVAR